MSISMFFKIKTVKFLLLFLLLFLASCGEVVTTKSKHMPPGELFDLAKIKERGTLIALCRYDPNTYFIYKGRPMGFEYEMLSLLAKHLGVKLEMRVPRDWNNVFALLESGEGDIIGANLSVTLNRLRVATFTEHFRTTRQMLVQRKPRNWRAMKVHEIEQNMIRNPINLIGQPVYVLKDSPHQKRLQHLAEEIGGRINIVEAPQEWDQSYLIKRVAEGTIKHTISDENIAKGYEAYYGNIDASTPISFPQRVAWAVRQDAPQLLNAINAWIAVHRDTKNPRFNIIFKKYYRNRAAFAERLSSGYIYGQKGGSISPYDKLFKKYAKDIGWDWKLIASLAYQESRFDPHIKSWMGAVGLMQVLPSTARELGVSYLENPKNNVIAGTRYLARMLKLWQRIPDEKERVKFVLASYNAGPGHLFDARALVRKYGGDENVWDGNVAEYLRKKADKKYYYDEVVKYGYCRGEEPFKYVEEILARYEIYRSLDEHIEHANKKQ
ncbi:MAG: transporter substrate-binding domain-containing protein [Fibrobacteria bacterium]|nr:transporter substrate-binding domain-containing protein [Fibrobacteria bacterium]